MKVIDASYDILTFQPEIDIRDICIAYCLCYGTSVPDDFKSQCEFVRKHRVHESPLEHSRLTVLFNINRGISHELVRHRHCSFTQQSTRYCNYSNERFGSELTFIKDKTIFNNADDYKNWVEGRLDDEAEYFARLENGGTPEQARGILPNDLATKLIVTTNYREWRNIFKLRCDSPAHYQMREVMIPLLRELQEALPCIFEDIQCQK